MYPVLSSIRTLAATFIAVTAILAIAATALAVDYGPTQILRTAPDDAGLVISDIAAGFGTVAVAWVEAGEGPTGARSYLRRSLDGGVTFQPKVALRGGRTAYDAQIATCYQQTFAVATWPTASGRPKVGLDVWGNLEGPSGHGFSALPDARGVRPDVACAGQWLAVAWFDDSTTPAHVKVTISRRTDACSGACITQKELDLGAGRVRHGLSIAITDSMAYVAWKPDTTLQLKRIAIDWDGSMTAEMRPSVTVVDSASASQQLLAADGSDVALAYVYQGDTRVRVSTDRGRTFGGPRILYEAPCTDCGAGSSPMSIDMLDGYTLVEVVAGPPGGTIGLLSDDHFETWTETSTPEGGRQVGALFYDESDDLAVAEARDNTIHPFPGQPGPANQRIRFRTALIP